MPRFRVSFQTVAGQCWYDVDDRTEAIRRARLERGIVLEEKPWPPGTDPDIARFAANFEQVWP